MSPAEKPKYHGLSSKILDAIREEVRVARDRGPVSSDYYAKQANPKDGGYAKCNYVKGDGQRVLPADRRAKDLVIRTKPNLAAKRKRPQR